ncbi:unnamed protein product, partial [Musa acuminata var. zebrina]
RHEFTQVKVPCKVDISVSRNGADGHRSPTPPAAPPRRPPRVVGLCHLLARLP